MRFIPYWAVLLALTVSQASASVPQNATADAMHKLVNAYYEKGLFSGSVLVAQDNEIIYEESFGFADKENKIKNERDTGMRINSITKVYTAAAILLLHESNKLKLSDSVCMYLPGFCKQFPTLKVHQLLDYTSGLPDLPATMGSEELLKMHSEQDILDLLLTTKADFEPGKGQKYSSGGYYVAGMLIQKLTGIPAIEFMQKNLIAKTALKHTGFFSDSSQEKQLAIGYRWDYLDENIEVAPKEHPSMLGTAWGMYSTAHDLYMLNKALWDGKIIQKSSLQQMQTPIIENKPLALGVKVSNFNGKKVIHKDGGSAGFCSEMHYYPEDKLHIIVLANLSSMLPVFDLAKSLGAIFHTQPYFLPQDYVTVFADEQQIKSISGKYDVSALGKPGDELFITQKDGSLILGVTGEPDRHLFYEGYGLYGFRFYKNYKIRFHKNAAGEVTGIVIIQPSGIEFTFPKTK